MIKKLWLVGEGDGRVIGGECVAQCLRAAKDRAGAGHSGEHQVIGFQIESLSEKLDHIVGRLKVDGFDL